MKLPLPLLGWPLLPVPDKHGQLHYPSLEESIRQTIQVILSTRPGEQLMRSEFGGGLTEFLHQSNTLTTQRRIRDRITESLQQWERRIDVNRVEVAEVEGAPTRLRIEIGYRLRRTGVANSFGLTLELEP